MNRLSPLLSALGLIACLLAAPALTPPASAGDAGNAGNAASENSRTYRFVERYPDFVGTVTATASANAPISCSFRMLWTMETLEFAVIANCRIDPGSRTGQRVVISGEITDQITGEPEIVVGKCRDVRSSNPNSGKVRLRCDFGPLYQ